MIVKLIIRGVLSFPSIEINLKRNVKLISSNLSVYVVCHNV